MSMHLGILWPFRRTLYTPLLRAQVQFLVRELEILPFLFFFSAQHPPPPKKCPYPLTQLNSSSRNLPKEIISS